MIEKFPGSVCNLIVETHWLPEEVTEGDSFSKMGLSQIAKFLTTRSCQPNEALACIAVEDGFVFFGCELFRQRLADWVTQ